MAHLEPKPEHPDNGIPRELFWGRRRQQNFVQSLADAEMNSDLVRNNRSISSTGFEMAQLLQISKMKYLGSCEECEKDDDKSFVFRQLNGYRPKGIKLLTKKLPYLKFPK